ncbi:Ribose-phosphate pyrophosphokinase 2 [Lucilia cuprina]|nr:Ribose-phosphate pyrophosphokinase 2 [Lucilia cuprina]
MYFVTSIADRLNVEFALIHKERRRPMRWLSMVLVRWMLRINCYNWSMIMAEYLWYNVHAADRLCHFKHMASFRTQKFPRINNACFEAVVVTNTIPQDGHMRDCQNPCIDVSNNFAEACAKTQNNGEVSVLIFSQIVPYHCNKDKILLSIHAYEFSSIVSKRLVTYIY